MFAPQNEPQAETCSGQFLEVGQSFSGVEGLIPSILIHSLAQLFAHSVTGTPADPACSGPVCIVKPVNPIDYLMSSIRHEEPPRPWTLLRSWPIQLLPCRVPFGQELRCIEDRDLAPAIQGYEVQQFDDSRRFIELTRMSSAADSESQWRLRLIEAALWVEQGEGDEAWHQLQLALSWRNRREEEPLLLDALPAISIGEWLVMATIALATGSLDTAECYASEAVARVQQNPTLCVADVLRDSRADTMTVFAAVRLAQQRFREAETLLQLAYDAHILAGDLEQVVVDLILLADVEHYAGNHSAAIYLLCEAQSVIDDECDSTRHCRLDALKQIIHQRLHEGRPPRRRKATQSLN